MPVCMVVSSHGACMCVCVHVLGPGVYACMLYTSVCVCGVVSGSNVCWCRSMCVHPALCVCVYIQQCREVPIPLGPLTPSLPLCPPTRLPPCPAAPVNLVPLPWTRPEPGGTAGLVSLAPPLRGGGTGSLNPWVLSRPGESLLMSPRSPQRPRARGRVPASPRQRPCMQHTTKVRGGVLDGGT